MLTDLQRPIIRRTRRLIRAMHRNAARLEDWVDRWEDILDADWYGWPT